jgi:hypothetical protein
MLTQLSNKKRSSTRLRPLAIRLFLANVSSTSPTTAPCPDPWLVASRSSQCGRACLRPLTPTPPHSRLLRHRDRVGAAVLPQALRLLAADGRVRVWIKTLRVAIVQGWAIAFEKRKFNLQIHRKLILWSLTLRYATHATWEFELKFRIEYFIKPQQNIYI